MKFRLSPLHHSDDPLGYEPPVTVDLPDTTAPERGSFRFAPDNFLPATPPPLPAQDPFGSVGTGPVSRTQKINLVSAETADPFAGLGDASQSSSPLSDSVRLAPLVKGDGYFEVFDSSAQPEEAGGAFTKGAGEDFSKFCKFTKIQEQDDGNVMVWGIATLEQPDLDNEVCDYPTAKDAYQAWSLAAVTRTSGAGQEVSLGPIRYQHSTEPAGKATKIQYDDDAREIWLGSVPISDDIRKELQQGFLTGYSQGGSYAWRKCTECGKNLTLQQANNFCPDCKKQVPVRFGLKRLTEVSYVDSPCTGQGFDYVKRDGSSRFVSFAKRADRQAANGVRVLDRTRIYRGRGEFQIWKSTVEIDGRTRTIVHWPDGHLVA